MQSVSHPVVEPPVQYNPPHSAATRKGTV
jgi:hypothetical protein